MLRKMMIALLATAAFGVLAPEAAQARGGFGGHGGGGFGGHGGFGGGGGWHGGGGGGFAAFHGVPGGGYAFHPGMVGGGPRFGPGFRHHVFIGGAGFVGPYYDSGYDGYYGYGSYPDDAYYDGGYVETTTCYLVRRHVMTRYGWRWGTVQICQ
jgi:hypothetical protein